MAYDGDGEYLPGEWCTFCKVSVKCRARAEEKMKLARLEFKMPPLLTDAEIEEVLDVLPDLTKWANEITAYASLYTMITCTASITRCSTSCSIRDFEFQNFADLPLRILI